MILEIPKPRLLEIKFTSHSLNEIIQIPFALKINNDIEIQKTFFDAIIVIYRIVL